MRKFLQVLILSILCNGYCLAQEAGNYAQFDCDAFVKSVGSVLTMGALFKGACAAQLNEQSDLQSTTCRASHAFEEILLQQVPLANDCVENHSDGPVPGLILSQMLTLYGESNREYAAKLEKFEPGN